METRCETKQVCNKGGNRQNPNHGPKWTVSIANHEVPIRIARQSSHYWDGFEICAKLLNSVVESHGRLVRRVHRVCRRHTQTYNSFLLTRLSSERALALPSCLFACVYSYVYSSPISLPLSLHNKLVVKFPPEVHCYDLAQQDALMLPFMHKVIHQDTVGHDERLRHTLEIGIEHPVSIAIRNLPS
jgi:hypothetical protein